MGELALTFRIFLLFLFLDLAALVLYGLVTFFHTRRERVSREIRRKLLGGKEGKGMGSNLEIPERRWRRRRLFFAYLKAFRELSQSIEVSDAQKRILLDLFTRNRIDIHFIRRLSSHSRYKRKEAATFLAHIPSQASKRALIRALERETSDPVRLLLVYGIVRHDSRAALPSIIDTLGRCSPFYGKRIAKLLSRWGKIVGDYFPLLSPRSEREIRHLLVEMAALTPAPYYREYLLSTLEGSDQELREKAFRTLMENYGGAVDFAPFLRDQNEQIRSMAILGEGKKRGGGCCRNLLPLLADPHMKSSALTALDNMVRETPEMLSDLLDAYFTETVEDVRKGLLQILATKAEYFIGTMLGREDPRIPPLIQALYMNQRITGVVNFLNRNRNPEISDRISGILKPVLPQNIGAAAELCGYLNQDDLQKLGLTPAERGRERRRESRESNKALFLVPILLAALGLVPALYGLGIAAGHGAEGIVTEAVGLVDFILFFNLLFAWYAFTLNGSYLLILGLSFLGLHSRNREWAIKERSLLFHPGILPKISIIAPAFNEERSIIESINSLLSLDYPRFEVIVVNDGSSDGTLQRAISYFQLERSWRRATGDLQTGDIRGLYTNPRYPNLLVIDKENGGKADSLNSGINFASGSYFAGIDSDSLLEPDALLKLSAAFLDQEERVVATGGNIFPINGSKVRKGHILEKRLPGNPLARIQAVEYIRAFMAGRIGWSFIRALLIISGAFGIFERREVLRIRGYLTGKEQFHKDTVGEDMELVVRLQRKLREAGKSFAILYQHNANCWTEVPEGWKVFSRQRDRWQRGLIDIIHFHRSMMFNSRYGTSGLVAFPYYLIFEIFGPLLEAQGYLLVLISLILGMLTLPYLLLLLSATILFGVLISVISLIFAQWSGNRFSPGDRVRLVLTALGENFGPRQVISLLRVKGFFSSLRMVSGWGKMERRGF